MKKVKKLLCLILAMCLTLSLAACNGEDGGGDTPATPEAPEATPTPEPTPRDIEWIDAGPFQYDASRIVYRTDFEDGLGDWQRRMVGDATDHSSYNTFMERHGTTYIDMELSDVSKSGSYSMLIANRLTGWNGAILDITDYLLDDVSMYEAFAWVNMPDDAMPGRLHLSLQTVEYMGGIKNEEYIWLSDFDGEGGIFSKFVLPAGTEDPGNNEDLSPFYNIPEGYSTQDGWVLLHGTFPAMKILYDEFYIYIESTLGLATEQDFYVDELVILTAQ